MTETAEVAQALVRQYLNGRDLSRDLLEAIVWVTQEERSFTRPAQLTAPMRALIDRHAGALPVRSAGPDPVAPADSVPAAQWTMAQWVGRTVRGLPGMPNRRAAHLDLSSVSAPQKYSA